MGSGANMFIIFLVISLALNLSNPTAWGSPMVELITISAETGEISLSGISSQALAIFSLSLAAGVIAGIFFQDASYGLFAGFTTFMAGFILVPVNFFASSDIPMFIRLMVAVPLAFMYIFALIGWFRGSEL